MNKIYFLLLAVLYIGSSCMMPTDGQSLPENPASREETPAGTENLVVPRNINDIIANAESFLRLARTQYQRKEIPASVASASAAIQLIPSYMDAYLFMANVLSEEFEDKTVARIAALRAYNLAEAQNNGPAAFEAMRLLVKMDPANTAYQLKLARLYRLSEGDKKMAMELYQKILRDNPKSPDALLGMAQTYSNLNDYNAALNWLEKYFKAAHTGSDAYLLRAYVYSKSGKLELASQDIEKVIQDEKIMESSEGSLAYVIWCEVLTAMGKYDIALNTPLFFGMTFFPQQKNMFDMYRAIIYEKKNDFAAADSIYERLLTKGFADMISTFYMMRGMNLLANKEFDKAKPTIDKFLQITSKGNMLKVWLLFWEDSVQSKAASVESALIPLLKEHVEQDPQYILGHLCLGTYYYVTKKPEAAGYLGKVAELAGTNDALLNYAQLAKEMLKQ